LVLLSLFAPLAEAREKAVKPAKIRISGVGLWRDREMRLAMERVLGSTRGPTLGANAIEDMAFLLFSVFADEGYQSPVITIRLRLANGQMEKHQLTQNLDVNLNQGSAASEVLFDVSTGERSYLETVRISGLHALDTKEGEAFFMPPPTLIATKAGRAYSLSRMKRSAQKLRDELRLRGYAEANVQAERVDADKNVGGPVTVQVKVSEGPLWVFSDLRYEKADAREMGFASAVRENMAWTPPMQQRMTEEIRQAYYKKGYADVAVRLRPEAAAEQAGRRMVSVHADIDPGPSVAVGNIRFEGNRETSTAILQRRVQVKTGDPLDLVKLERSRYRLSRLGVFEAVDLRYEPESGVVRDPIYVLRESQRYEANLFAGYGSYEQLRGGVEVLQRNLFGRAHQSRLEIVQSVKSSRGEYTYTVPELFGEAVDGTARAFGLQREELSFLRQEYGANLALKRHIALLNADGSLGYTFQSLKNRDNELTTRASDNKQVNVASIDLGLTRDRRDNPLRPRKGYRWFGQVEAASQALGGEVNYERIELGGAYHFSVGHWQFVHLGLMHGLLTTFGTSDLNVPVNKRFFLGGDSSVRGYQEGEASPRGADGRFIGAKTYTVLNIEYEALLTETLSAVVFVDALGEAARLADYPFAERLYSAGIGLRYQTLVGPIRLEYGRNLNPRVGDPSGTLHLSIGFPF